MKRQVLRPPQCPPQQRSGALGADDTGEQGADGEDERGQHRASRRHANGHGASIARGRTVMLLGTGSNHSKESVRTLCYLR